MKIEIHASRSTRSGIGHIIRYTYSSHYRYTLDIHIVRILDMSYSIVMRPAVSSTNRRHIRKQKFPFIIIDGFKRLGVRYNLRKPFGYFQTYLMRVGPYNVMFSQLFFRRPAFMNYNFIFCNMKTYLSTNHSSLMYFLIGEQNSIEMFIVLKK